MERLTQTSDKGGVAFTFDLDVTCQPSEMKKILKIAEKLKEYEDLEEQGLLLRLPCKVGDTIYHIWNVDDKPEIQEIKIATLTNLVAHMENGNFGKYIFLTQAEAEQKLKEMVRIKC